MEPDRDVLTLSAPDRPPLRPAAYVVRHWRGELSLAVSYWLNGFLLSLVAFGVTKLLFLANIQSAPRSWLAVISAWTVFVLLVGAWQLVGTWRSAARRIRERRLARRWAVWAQLARVMVALSAVSLAVQTVRNTGPSTYASLQIVFGVDPIGPHTIRLADGGATIMLSGGIGTGVADQFRALLDASPDIRRVELASNGGRVTEAQAIAAVIRARGLATHAAGFCASACTIVYIAGTTRTLGPAGQLGFHRYSFSGLTPAQENALNEKGRRTLLDAGVARAFVDRVFETPASEVWIPNQAALIGAHVVTGLD